VRCFLKAIIIIKRNSYVLRERLREVERGFGGKNIGGGALSLIFFSLFFFLSL